MILEPVAKRRDGALVGVHIEVVTEVVSGGPLLGIAATYPGRGSVGEDLVEGGRACGTGVDLTPVGLVRDVAPRIKTQDQGVGPVVSHQLLSLKVTRPSSRN